MKLSNLILKRVTQALSKEEEQLFQEWFSESEQNKKLYSFLKIQKKQGADLSKLRDWDSDAAWVKIIEQYELRKNKSKKPFGLTPILKYAAVFLGIATFSYGYLQFSKQKTETKASNKNAITLQLDNGEIHTLYNNNDYAIKNKDGNILGFQNKNKLDYKDTEVGEKLTYNKLTIPYGKRFEISLSDGTTVYLNAGSSLRYPVKFIEGLDRHVYLIGEAFFDVSEDKAHPFIVSTSEMDVTVLGTEFNVAAYPEDQFISTVLVEGSVNLSNSKTNRKQEVETVKLLPGYKADWALGSGKTVLDQVDTDIYTGWIEGRLVLKNLPFNTIIKKLERHYNVEIVNNYNAFDAQIFTATFDVETIDEVLSSFAENKSFHFKTKGNTITIESPNQE